MWKYVAVLFVLGACTGRPQGGSEDCFGIYCNTNDNDTETDGDYGEDHYYGEGELYAEYDLGNLSSLSRQSLYYKTRPSFRVVFRRINFSGVRARGLRAPRRMNFQRTLVNTGKAWNRTHARFVAPFTGGYFFAFHGFSARNSNFTMALMRNNKWQVMAYGRRGTYQHGSSSAFLPLNRRDVMTLQLMEGGVYENPYVNSYNSFSVFMMYRSDHV